MAQISSVHSKRQISKEEFDDNWDNIFKKKANMY
jgi:hypothetical protein